MTDEEKKVVRELKHYCNLTQYWKNVEYTKYEFDDYIKTVLNLIEKQSKEIEELKEIYQTGYVNGCVSKVYEINKKWEDKIKAKIEEYKEKCKNCNFKGKICEEFTKNYNCTIAICLNEFYSLLNKEMGDK